MQPAGESEGLLQFLYQTPIGLAQVDVRGEVQLLNALGAQLLLPFAPDGELGNLFDIFCALDPSLAEWFDAPADRRGTLRDRRVELPARGGGEVTHLSLTMLEVNPGVWMAAFSDVSSLVKQEQIAQRAVAEQANQRGRAEMAASVLHDVGNSLVGVGAAAAHQLAEPDWDEQAQLTKLLGLFERSSAQVDTALGPGKGAALSTFVRTLTEAVAQREESSRAFARRCAQSIATVQEVLNIQRTYAGMMPTGDREPTDLVAIVRDALRLQQPVIASSGLELDLQVPQSRVLIDGDRTQLVQTVLNLLKNACEAMRTRRPPTSGTLSVAVIADDGSATLTVTDEGSGFAPEQATSLLERGATTKSQGTGLGLANAKNTAEAHGGELKLSSPGPNRGATAELKLPVYQREPAQ